GTGKTTALLDFWQTLLENKCALPLYVPLNEYTAESNFIQEYIKTNYEQIDIDTLKYNFVLLLDGFNEMPHKNPLPLMQEIANWLNKKSSNINVIITSRDEFTTDYLIKFQQYDVQPLDINVVKNYLDSDSSTVNELYSPMMLDLYKNTDKQKKQAKKKRVPINFKDGLKRGEILYNYLLGQIVNCVIQGQIDQIVPVWYTLFEVAPYIAYDMEASNIYYIKKAILEQKISTFCKQFPVENQIKKCSEWLQNLIKNKKRYQLKVSDDEVQKILLVDNKYLFRKDENEQYIFRHQHFRDFLSALHIANVIRNSLINDVNLSLEGSNDHDLMDWPVSDTEYIYLSPEVYNRKWPDHICEMLGDYYGDYKHRTKYDKQYRTELHDLLDRLRGLQRVESSYAVRNIINTWRKARDNRIIDENLALLDLSQTSLNGVILADKQFFTKFDGSIISESTLLSNGHFGAVRSAVYSADGSRILSASYDCTVKEWDRETENCIHTFTGHTQRVRSAVYSRDGKRILSASYDCTVKEWDRETENCIHTFTGHTDIVQDVVYSADGSRILSASYDGTVKEWDRETEICIHTFKIDSASDRVNSVRYSLDGTCILATNRKGTIEEWLIKNVTLRHTYAVNGHKQNTCSAVYSRDGKRILSASYDGTVKEWDRETENCIHTYPDQMDSGEWSAEVRSAVYGGKNDEYILSASHDGTVKEWNRTTEKCVCTFKGHDHWVRSAVYSDDWKYVLSASEDGTIKEWDRETQICLRTFKGSPNWVRNVVLSDDGCRVLTAFDRNIVEWDKKKGVYLQIFSGHSDFVRSAVYGGKNDEYILSASHDGTVKEWNRTTGEPTDIINVYPDRVNIAVYNKDRTRILFALCNGTIKEYDIQTKEILHTFTGHNKEVCSMMYSKNELYILSASEDGTVREWNRETAIESLQYTHGSSVYSVRYSYDTFYILSAANDHTIKEYNKKNCTSKVFGDSACQEKHDSRVYSVVYSKDDKYILSASYDGTVKEWDRETGNCIHTFEGLNNGVRTATYSSDKCICAISNNGVIMEWNRENTKSPLCKKQLFGLFIKNCSFKGCSFVSEEINRLVQLYSGNVQNAFLRSIVAKKLRGKPREIHIALDTDDGKPKNLILTGSNGCGKTSMLIELKQAVEDIIAGKVNNEFVANFSDSDSEVIQVLRLEHKMRYYKCVFISAVHNNHWSSMGDDISLDFWEKLKDIQVNIYRCTSNNSIERKFWIELLKKIENILQGLFVNKTIKLNYDTKNNDFRMYYTFGNSSENVGMLQRHQLPDGYSAVLNIFWAIVKPWKDMTIPFKRIRGLVIIDELEAHLHVQMQKDILPYLMKLFPEVQFIVATHSPYILNSAENVVIYDMEKEEIIKKSDELYELSGLSIDEITKTLLGCDKYSKAVRTLLKKYDKDCDNKYVKGAYETYDKLDSILSDTNPLKWALRKRRKWLKGADYEEVK
ncbi:MAG: AAA family ATPase, partial [Candidatus Bathyarchaeota archaeon]|nr:AAA family ATPase [Candidatus Termiticorpusculum sp.]